MPPNTTYEKDSRGRVRVTTECLNGRTKQEFLEETDINQILKRWIKTGQAPFMASGVAYGDFSGVTDFQESINIVTSTKQQFAALPSHLRDRFGNDPNQLLAFLENDENLEEARKLGIVAKPEPEPDPDPAIIVPNNSPAGGDNPPD